MGNGGKSKRASITLEMFRGGVPEGEWVRREKLGRAGRGYRNHRSNCA